MWLIFLKLIPSGTLLLGSCKEVSSLLRWDTQRATQSHTIQVQLGELMSLIGSLRGVWVSLRNCVTEKPYPNMGDDSGNTSHCSTAVNSVSRHEAGKEWWLEPALRVWWPPNSGVMQQPWSPEHLLHIALIKDGSSLVLARGRRPTRATGVSKVILFIYQLQVWGCCLLLNVLPHVYTL